MATKFFTTVPQTAAFQISGKYWLILQKLAFLINSACTLACYNVAGSVCLGCGLGSKHYSLQVGGILITGES